jgi:hypothetical protein
MLRLQSRFVPVSPDVAQVKRFLRHQGKSQTAAQNLPAAFPERSIQFNHGFAHACQESRMPAEVHSENAFGGSD